MMIKKIKYSCIIILLITVSVLNGCRKSIYIQKVWKTGRYDLAANIGYAVLDKICYNFGLSSARKILRKGWGINKKSYSNRTYVKALMQISIIKLPPMAKISRELIFTAFPFFTSDISSVFVTLYLNGHLLKKITLQPGWNAYFVPIKGKYFSLKENTLILKHSFDYRTSKKRGLPGERKPAVGYDKLCLIKKELAQKEKEVKHNFIHLNQLRIGGDTRPVLETRANNHFSYQLMLSEPAELRFSLGLSEEKAQKIEQIEYQILAHQKKGEELLFSQLYHSDNDELWNNWNDFTLDLSPYAGSNLSLCFETRLVAKKGHAVDTIDWGNPFLIKQQDKGKEKLNVIIYLVDTLRADHLGCYGNREIQTPHIDRFASQGVLFENAYAQASWTKPSTATLLTSTYPSYHDAIKRNDTLTSEISTLAEVLKERGYLTGAFISQVNVSADFGFYQGFDSYLETYYPIKQRPLYAHHMNDFIFPWLKKNVDNPFFLYIHTNDPHDPYNPPAPYNKMYDDNYAGSINGSVRTLEDILFGNIKVKPRDIQHLNALYKGEVTINDSAFGKFVEKLKELKLYDRTLIIFTADHGEEFWEHKGVKHALTLYDEVIHIPLMMRLPWNIPAGLKINSPVRTIDVMPTILKLLHFNPPQQCQGKSLIPLIKNKKQHEAKEIYCEEDFGDKVMQSIRKADWKLIYYPKTGLVELFNIKKDHKEQNNLATHYPELIQSLLKKINLWHQQQIKRRKGLHRTRAKKLSEETIKQLKALGYLQ
jgi:arylsulfatase A-like enzyme